MMTDRVRHADIERACQQYNAARGLTDWNSIGRLQWADVRGDGGEYRPHLYIVCNLNGGVTTSDLRGRTMRETLARIQEATP